MIKTSASACVLSIYFQPWCAAFLFFTGRESTYLWFDSPVTKNSLQSIVQQFLSYLVRPDSTPFPAAAPSLAVAVTSPPHSEGAVLTLLRMQLSSYRLTVVQRLLAMCSHDTYDNIVDFQWYLSVLLDLTYVAVRR